LKKERQLTDDELASYLDTIDKRLELRQEIVTMKNSFDEISYFTNTADILYQYYELVENGGFSETKTDKVTAAGNSILKYFSGVSMEPDASCSKEDCAAPKELPRQTGMSPLYKVNRNRSTSNTSSDPDTKRTLLDKYLIFTEMDYVREIDMDGCDKCAHCGSTVVTLMSNDGYIFCNDCNTVEYIIIDHEKPSYRDPPKEISYFAYKRINHLIINVFMNRIFGLIRHFYCLLSVLKSSDFVRQIHVIG
jgi:DNA-directed RNA polymerase subunit RPC12/RpoP